MESVVIAAPRTYSLEQLRRAIPTGYRVDDADGGGLVVQSRGSRAYVGLDPHIADELEPDEWSRIEGLVSDPVFFVLDYVDIVLCKELLAAIADRPDVAVDNDHGTVLPGHEFIQRIRNYPEWDWRRDLF